MKQEKNFVISEFKNPSGEIVFGVTGWLDGKRVRKNFPTFAEAKVEANGLEIHLLQGGMRTTDNAEERMMTVPPARFPR